MKNLKTILALMIFSPLIICAKERKIELNKHFYKGPRSQLEPIPVEVFIDDDNNELTIEFHKAWQPVIIEVEDEHGMTVYATIYVPNEKKTLVIPLGIVLSEKYQLIISDRNQSLIGNLH